MTFDEAWAAHLKRNNIIQPDRQTFAHGWNAAIQAAEEIVRARHDPCEPWLDPGELTKALETWVHT